MSIVAGDCPSLGPQRFLAAADKHSNDNTKPMHIEGGAGGMGGLEMGLEHLPEPHSKRLSFRKSI